MNVAERVGFEPTVALATPVFKTGTFGRSVTSPQFASTLGARTFQAPSSFSPLFFFTIVVLAVKLKLF